MLLFIIWFFCCFARLFLYSFEIILWRNKKIDPTAKKIKRRTFAKVFINITEVSLFFMFLFNQIYDNTEGNKFLNLKNRFECAAKVYKGITL